MKKLLKIIKQKFFHKRLVRFKGLFELGDREIYVNEHDSQLNASNDLEK